MKFKSKPMKVKQQQESHAHHNNMMKINKSFNSDFTLIYQIQFSLSYSVEINLSTSTE